MNRVKVTSQIKVPYLEAKKKRNYALTANFRYDDEKGVSNVITFVDTKGEPVSLLLTPDFSFDLNKEVERLNYQSLLLRKKYDPTLDHIVIEDENLEVDAYTENIEYKIEVLSRIKALKDNDDKNTLHNVYRTVNGSIAGLTDKVIFKHIMEIAEKDPKVIAKVLDDVDFEYKAIIAQATESGILKLENGMYKNKIGAVLAGDLSEMVFYLKKNEDYKNGLQAQVIVKEKLSTPITTEQVRAVQIEDDQIIDTGEPELFERAPAYNQVLSQVQIESIVQDAVNRGIGVEVRSGGWIVPLSQPSMKAMRIHELMAWYQANPNEAELLREVIKLSEEE